MKMNLDNRREILHSLYDILTQGDSRYLDPESEKTLAIFLEKRAISLEEKEFPNIDKPNEGNISKHLVQGPEKLVAEALLKWKGFKDNKIFFERRFLGSVADVFAEREGFIILVECCSCRISKIIDYLSQGDEVWILTRGENPWEEKPLLEKMQWFVFTKGPKWDEIYSKFHKINEEELKKVKSPLDRL